LPYSPSGGRDSYKKHREADKCPKDVKGGLGELLARFNRLHISFLDSRCGTSKPQFAGVFGYISLRHAIAPHFFCEESELTGLNPRGVLDHRSFLNPAI
jgi:hypothetical protein